MLTAAQRIAVRDLLIGVGVQVGVLAITAVAAWLVGGGKAGLSALFGGAAYTLPNALFAVRIACSVSRPGGASPLTFFLGEFFKIGSAIGLLFAAVWLWRDLVWVAWFVGLIAALKSYIFVYLIRKKI